MAKKLSCPVLVAKFTDPYERLLVPFNGSLGSQRALEIALDLSQQLDATVGVVTVVEPSYLHGESSSTGQWERDMLKQVRELSHVYKKTVEEHVRHGNPVKEISAVAGDYQLLVMGHDDPSAMFSVDSAGMIADKSPCSVLLVS
jgi:nucleotide-binding universal stress UspA family protein